MIKRLTLFFNPLSRSEILILELYSGPHDAAGKIASFGVELETLGGSDTLALADALEAMAQKLRNAHSAGKLS